MLVLRPIRNVFVTIVMVLVIGEIDVTRVVGSVAVVVVDTSASGI
jgi:hypothetical protein